MPSAQRKCVYNDFKYDVVDPGKRVVGSPQTVVGNIKECQDQCDGNQECNSIRFCPNSGLCALFPKVLTGIEEMKEVTACHSSYQTTCDGVGKRFSYKS